MWYCGMMAETTSIKVSPAVRNRLRQYKAEHGDTYDRAIKRLLEDTEY